MGTKVTICMEKIFNTFLASPIGFVWLRGTEHGVTALDFLDKKCGSEDRTLPEVILRAKAELQEYFEGSRKKFTVPVLPEGTVFQQQVWKQLQKIPYGKTITYGDLTIRIGHDKRYARAVGSANGQNPISILIPCHRVIGAQGKLTGYASGIWRKKWLLEHEGSLINQQLHLFR